jgi:NodT family efflux transporter outer membrane factor (OMF) lipoprotein
MATGYRIRLLFFVALLTFAGGLCGCTSLSEYIQNGFKVGPNYRRPPAPVAENWIDASDKRVRSQADDISKWWTVFNDPVLNQLTCFAYKQNLTLREAGFRVLQARAQLGVSIGEFFPQTQTGTGDFNWNNSSSRTAFSEFIPKRWYGQYDLGFNLAWELDFWGKFRRGIESSKANLDFSVEDFDDVLVTLLADVATNYVNMRTAEQRIKYARDNVELQEKTVKVIENRQKVEVAKQLDVDQAKGILYQTAATIPELEITERQSANALCILLGIPPEELSQKLGKGSIPTAPVEVATGIPADLLRRRPDVRRAERQAATQCPLIGVAEADFYPAISLVGDLGYSAEFFKNLFSTHATTGAFGPQFTWQILNYGRILNNVRFQDAKFQELVAAYQQSVLTAQQEVENGLVQFLKAQTRTKLQEQSVYYADQTVKIVLAQYELGTVNIVQLIQIEQNLVLQQDTLAQAQGEIALGLIQVYEALGGGWQIRLTGCDPQAAKDPTTATPDAGKGKDNSQPIEQASLRPVIADPIIVSPAGAGNQVQDSGSRPALLPPVPMLPMPGPRNSKGS